MDFKSLDVELDAHGKIKGLVGIVERLFSITSLIENNLGHMAQARAWRSFLPAPSEAVRSKIVAIA